MREPFKAPAIIRKSPIVNLVAKFHPNHFRNGRLGAKQMTDIRKARSSAVILGVCAAALTAPVYAQELEEIVVVARKREESLQEVPISIATFSAEDLEVQGIDSLEGHRPPERGHHLRQGLLAAGHPRGDARPVPPRAGVPTWPCCSTTWTYPARRYEPPAVRSP